MTRRIVVATMVMAASLIGTAAVQAQPIHIPVHAMFSNSRTVSFTLSNESTETVQMTVNGNPVTLEPGKSAKVKALEGEKILATNTTSHYAAGAVIVVASSAIADARIVLH